jgi:oxygen-independent coproporphyrinogen-3 oxidase
LPTGGPLSLYIHIPFCETLCWFCGCNTKATRRYAPVAAYLDGLRREIDLVSRHLPEAQTVSHLHFGGGSPTLLSAVDFSWLMTFLDQCFGFAAEAEIAIEIDPRTVDAERIRAYAGAGVNRASVGIQDFDRTVQTAINRLQPFGMTAGVVDELRAAGIDKLNFDLMYGLPHQTVAGVETMIDQAVGLAPERVALFGYAHVPWMKKHQRLIPKEALPDAQTRFAQQEAAAARLVGAGYVRIGLDHFARPEDPLAQAAARSELRRNFQGYTTDAAAALIGFGASAISSLPQGYVQNHTETRTYLEDTGSGRLPVSKGVVLSDDDRLRRAAIEQLMCSLRLDAGNSRYAALVAAARDRLRDLELDGLIAVRGGTLEVREAGRPFVRQVAAVFDAYLAEAQKGRHSAAV